MCAEIGVASRGDGGDLFAVYVRYMFQWAYERSQRQHAGSPPLLFHGIQQADSLQLHTAGLRTPAAWVEHDGIAYHNFGGIEVALPIDLYRRLYGVRSLAGHVAQFTPADAAAKFAELKNFGPWELDLANCSRF